MKGFLYGLGFGAEAPDIVLVKIGQTSDPAKRIMTHRCSFPGWAFIFCLWLPEVNQSEHWLKQLYAPYGWQGSEEVFSLPLKELTFLESLNLTFLRTVPHLGIPFSLMREMDADGRWDLFWDEARKRGRQIA